MTTPQRDFWDGKRVLVTGHTGFKGSWLSLWLHRLGARVTGYALTPPTDPSLFALARLGELVDSRIADVRDAATLLRVMAETAPEIVIHMAAQPLVRDSYRLPVETYATNVMGTVHLLEAVRACASVRAVVNVTTDKCYENREWVWGYRENEPMGGFDPYSSSKACAELVTAAYRSSFFQRSATTAAPLALASARAGNVVGGGDWATDRLVPDCLRALLAGESIRIRNPHAIRPWQHVLEPLRGYLTLARSLYEAGDDFAEAWNFGPSDDDARPVEWIVRQLCELWGEHAGYRVDAGEHPHEAHYLKLDCSKAHARLDWQPCWNLRTTLESIVVWTRAYREGEDLRAVSLAQIAQYETRLQELS
ncbi:MAG: CDP-glucose 4,6-dehydratase [Desulfuromonadales bacterium GWD2_61_12]|nr:MAG: CDP-glucose 4,6-dehydratase [Desulfuromonadales bacterium GWC2_61_20]OGR35388.1 MAG: CDP-glucose 4,6-dehydratase [Desulfuromonadales bacterium GWD2_61_12]HBT83916.1 CDP-glucose 4,6-dehydratase [Desulfuromonas sp.]